MKVEFVSPFVQAAREVIESELMSGVERGALTLQQAAFTCHEVTGMIGVTGSIRGTVLYGMSTATALNVVSTMMGQPFSSFDDLAQSGIAELGNVITGRAAMLLAEAGYPASISPPILIVGNGSTISTLDFHRVAVPLHTDCGEIEIQIGLKEASPSS